MSTPQVAPIDWNHKPLSEPWKLTDAQTLGLALSGGGFRASLFHIGVLARLAELDLLRHATLLSTVSGGSIVGAYYYLKVKDLLEGRGHASDRAAKASREAYIAIVKEIEQEFLDAVQTNIRARALLNPMSNAKMMVSDDYSDSDRMAELYDQHFYQPFAERLGLKSLTLEHLMIHPNAAAVGLSDIKAPFDVDAYNKDPNAKYKIPIININATSINSGHRWCFTAAWVGEFPVPQRSATPLCAAIDTNARLRRLQIDGDYSKFRADPDKWAAPLAAEFEKPRREKLQSLTLAHAVAASACVPGIFTPLSIHDLYRNSRQQEIVVELVDGGVYDNQGFDALVNADPGCDFIVCSDASGQLEDERAPSSAILSVARRSNDILMTRVRAKGYNRLCFEAKDNARFFHLRDEFQGNDDYPKIPIPVDRSNNNDDGLVYRLSGIRTDLDTFSDLEAYTLMYDGYCLCDSRVMTGKEQLNLGTPNQILPATPSDWKFLNIRRMLRGGDETKELLTQLYVGSNQSFKIFRLFSLNPFRLYALLAWVFAATLILPALGLCLMFPDAIRVAYVYITEHLGLLLPIVALFFFMKTRLENSPVIGAMLDKLRPLRRDMVMGLVYPLSIIGLVGTVAAAVHLATFDRMFKLTGRLPRD